jgi:hypothetical protein
LNCSNSYLSDFREYAELLKGRHISLNYSSVKTDYNFKLVINLIAHLGPAFWNSDPVSLKNQKHRIELMPEPEPEHSIFIIQYGIITFITDQNMVDWDRGFSCNL